MIFGIHVYQVKTVCHMQEWLLPVLSPVNELFIEVCFITLNPFQIF